MSKGCDKITTNIRPWYNGRTFPTLIYEGIYHHTFKSDQLS